MCDNDIKNRLKEVGGKIDDAKPQVVPWAGWKSLPHPGSLMKMELPRTAKQHRNSIQMLLRKQNGFNKFAGVDNYSGA